MFVFVRDTALTHYGDPIAYIIANAGSGSECTGAPEERRVDSF